MIFDLLRRDFDFCPAMEIYGGCTALITGASAGFGHRFVHQLAPYAHTLILVARRGDRLEAVENEVSRMGLTIIRYAVDLSDEAQVGELLRNLASGPAVDVLVNNAGVGDHGLFEDGEWPRVQAMLDVNINALTRLTHAVLPGMIPKGSGIIINVSSIAGMLPLPQMAVYAATKAYVSSFSEALRSELRGTGIRVTAVCPGPVDTEFFALAERPGSKPAPAPALFKVTADKVAYEAMKAAALDRARVIPGWFVRCVMLLTAAMPLFILRFFLNFRGRHYEGH